MPFGPGSAGLGNFPFNQPIAPHLSNINANLSMADEMGNYMADPAEYPAMSADMMGSMIPASFANMGMGQMVSDNSALGMFPHSRRAWRRFQSKPDGTRWCGFLHGRGL